MSHVICLDLWLSGKRFKGLPKEDKHLKNGMIDLPLWVAIPGSHLIHLWIDFVKSVPLCKEALQLELRILQSKSGHHFFTDCTNERLNQLKEVQLSIQKINYRNSAFKLMELVSEGIVGCYLQTYITLRQAGSLRNMYPYLKKDFTIHGIFGSIASSLLSSFLSISIGL